MRNKVPIVMAVLAFGVVLGSIPVVAASGGSPPLADAGLDQEVPLGSTVLLDATGSRDPDGGSLTYEWTIRTPSGAVMRPDCASCGRTEFVAAETGRYEVTVTVTDDEGNSRSDTLYVDVRGGDRSGPSTPTPSPPTTPPATPAPPEPPAGSDPPASAPDGPPSSGSPSSPNTGGPSSTTGPAMTSSTDGDGPAVPVEQYTVFDISGPKFGSTGVPQTFVVDTLQGFDGDVSIVWGVRESSGTGMSTTATFRREGTYSVYASASDGNTTVSDSLVIQIKSNRPPTVELGLEGEVEPGNTVTVVKQSVGDPDGQVVELEWSGPREVSIPEDEEISRTVTLTVTDNDGATAQDSVTISTATTTTYNNTTETESFVEITCYVSNEGMAEANYANQCAVEGADSRFRPTYGAGRRTVGPSRITAWEDNENVRLTFTVVDQSAQAASGNAQSATALDVQQDIHDDENEAAAEGPRVDPMADIDGVTVDTNGTTRTSASMSGLGTFSLNNRSVSADLNGDGEVNALDWDMKYRNRLDDQQSNGQERDDLQNYAETRRAAREQAQSGSGSGSDTTDTTGSTDGTDAAGADTSESAGSSGHAGTVEDDGPSTHDRDAPSGSTSDTGSTEDTDYDIPYQSGTADSSESSGSDASNDSGTDYSLPDRYTGSSGAGGGLS